MPHRPSLSVVPVATEDEPTSDNNSAAPYSVASTGRRVSAHRHETASHYSLSISSQSPNLVHPLVEKLEESRRQMEDIYVRRCYCCFSTFARFSTNGGHDHQMEKEFAASKYVHFRTAFIRVSFLMVLGVIGLSATSVRNQLWWRVSLLMGGVGPLYAAYGIYALRWRQQYLQMSRAASEKIFIGLLSLQTLFIVSAEWERTDLDYGMLVMHIGFVHNFTPLSAGTMQIITAAFGLLPFCLAQIVRFMFPAWRAISEPAEVTTAPPDSVSAFTCHATTGMEALLVRMVVPFVIFIYQVVVTMRRDESLRLDWLSGSNLQTQQKLLDLEKRRNEDLLTSMLPRKIIESLKASEPVEPQHFEDVTVIFAEICEFHRLSARLKPGDVVEVLNVVYLEFDRLSDLLCVYKVETVGQVYMAVVGCPEPMVNHADMAAHFALAAQCSMLKIRVRISKVVHSNSGRHGGGSALSRTELPANLCAEQGDSLPPPSVVAAPVAPQFVQEQDQGYPSEGKEDDMLVNIRVGLNSGPIRAGIVGIDSPRYKLFGDTVNTASRMESTCEPGRVQVSRSTLQRLTKGMFQVEDRGEIAIKGKGSMRTAFLCGYANLGDGGDRRVITGASPPLSVPTTVTQPLNAQEAGAVPGADDGDVAPDLTWWPPRPVLPPPSSNGPDLEDNAPRAEPPFGNRNSGESAKQPLQPVKSSAEVVAASLGREGTEVAEALDFAIPTSTSGTLPGRPPFSLWGSQTPNQADREFEEIAVSRSSSSETIPDSDSKVKLSCLDQLQLLFLLVPAAQKSPKRLAELREDLPNYMEQTCYTRVFFARNLTITWLLLLAVISFLDYFMRILETQSDTYRRAIVVRAVGNSLAGLMYLLLVTVPAFQKFTQHLTFVMLLLQGAALLSCSTMLYNSEPAIVALFGAYILFYTVCTVSQRLTLCSLTVSSYVIIEWARCNIKGVFDAAQNIAFCVVFVASMACSVCLQEHLQHVSHYEQECATRRLEEIRLAKAAGSQLLTSLLPPHVVDLVGKGASPIAEHHSGVTILFTDIKGFTAYSSQITAQKLVSVLNAMYSAFDEIIANWSLHKVEIIGDAYFVSAGCPPPPNPGEQEETSPDEYAMRAVEVALALLRTLPRVCDDTTVQMRVGLHTGPVVAGVVGKKGPRYHLFGSTVAYAEKMESHGIPGRVQLSDATHTLLESGSHDYDFEERHITVEGEEFAQRTWLVNRSNSRIAFQIQKKLMNQRRCNQQGNMNCTSQSVIRHVRAGNFSPFPLASQSSHLS